MFGHIAFSFHNSIVPSRISEHLMMFNDKNGFRQDCALASLQKHFLMYSETNSQRICIHYHADFKIFNLQRFCDESQIITLLAFRCSLPLVESVCTVVHTAHCYFGCAAKWLSLNSNIKETEILF